MNKKYESILVGINENNEFVFIDSIGVRDSNFSNEFSVVFEELEPRILDNETIDNEVESMLDCWDSDYKYGLLEEYDCKPSELKSKLKEDISIEECFDYNSLWSEENTVEKDGEEYHVYMCFRGSKSKYYDCNIVEFANPYIEELFETINKFGKEYHLKEIPQDLWEGLDVKLEMYEGMDTFDNDLKFIEKRLDF